MFQKNSKVEDGRVKAHETAEAASLKVHEIIDKVAEHTEHGSERARELKAAASEQAAATRESPAAPFTPARPVIVVTMVTTDM